MPSEKIVKCQMFMRFSLRMEKRGVSFQKRLKFVNLKPGRISLWTGEHPRRGEKAAKEVISPSPSHPGVHVEGEGNLWCRVKPLKMGDHSHCL
jgi:hypothetical protein